MRAFILASGVVSIAGSVAADPGGAEPIRAVPTTLVPCLPEGETYDLVAIEGEPALCWGVSCMRLSDRAAAMVPRPADAPSGRARAEVRDVRGEPSVCVGDVCKRVGARLAGAIAEERTSPTGYDDHVPHLEATLDGKAVVIGLTVWSVPKDKPLTLRAPSSYGRGGAAVIGIAVTGNLLVVSWSDCAGPCTVGQIVDSSGKNRGKSFRGGDTLRLDDRRFVVFGEYGDLQIFDLGGKPLGVLSLGTDPGVALAVALSDQAVGVLRTDGDWHRMVWVDAFEGLDPRVSSEAFLPACKP